MPGKNSYTTEELLDCGYNGLRGKGTAQLPVPPMLMFDRIVEINDNGGPHEKGQVIAELDVHPDLWFFDCHFPGDPVMPGCLGLDALWQMVGFYLTWADLPGMGRALGCGEVKFSGMVLQSTKIVRYEIDIRRVINRKTLILGIAEGRLLADGKEIYKAKDLRVGLFSEDQLKAGIG